MRWLATLRLAILLAAAGGLVAAVLGVINLPLGVVLVGVAMLVLGLALAGVAAMAYGRATGLSLWKALGLALRTLWELLLFVG